MVTSVNGLLNQILIVPLHEVHMQNGSCKEHLVHGNSTKNERFLIEAYKMEEKRNKNDRIYEHL